MARNANENNRLTNDLFLRDTNSISESSRYSIIDVFYSKSNGGVFTLKRLEICGQERIKK